MMDFEELKQLVRDVRAAQKRYFKAAHGTDEKIKLLYSAQHLERQLDRELQPSEQAELEL